MDDVWCSLDMAADIASLHTALADPFWPADLDLMVSTHEVEGMADMDASGFFLGGGDDRFMLPSSTTSSLSSKRSLSLDSGGSSGSGSFMLDLADASRYAGAAQPLGGRRRPRRRDDHAGYDGGHVFVLGLPVLLVILPSAALLPGPGQQHATTVSRHGAAAAWRTKWPREGEEQPLHVAGEKQQRRPGTAAGGSDEGRERKHRPALPHDVREEETGEAQRQLPCAEIAPSPLLKEGQDHGANQGGRVPQDVGGAGLGAGGEEQQAREAHPGQRLRGRHGAPAEAAEGQGPDHQGSIGRGGEPDGDGDGGVRRGGAGAPHPGVPPVDGAGQRHVRRRRHLLPAGAAQGHCQHQAPDRGRRLEPSLVPRGHDQGS